MAEAFKNLINADSVAHAGAAFQRVWPAFDRARFINTAGHQLDRLEFKARALQIASALETTLPTDFSDAAEVIEGALAPALPFDHKGEPIGLSSALGEDGLSGWVLWGVGEFVARRGMGDVPRAMACLHAITQRFTAEFAIRPFIDQRPDIALPILAQWVTDPSAHVRRLVSEGSRPRLPWGLRLQQIVKDPSPTLLLLLALQDDPSAYVRRSVANHLNDIAKDHPDRVAAWVQTHLKGADPARQALLRHASRSLIKAGHQPTLRAWGLGAAFKGSVACSLNHDQAAIGEDVSLSATLMSSSRHAQDLVIDYVVHHVRANGSSSPKVFKGWKLTLPAGASADVQKRHSLRPVTTRQLYPGLHRIDLHINGQPGASVSFELLPARAS